MKFQQGFAHRAADESAHGAFVAELHFAFCGMNVHIHRGRIDFQKQATDRKTSLHERSVIAFKQRVIDAAVFDWPLIDEDMLLLARGTRHARRAYQTPKTNFEFEVSSCD